MLAASWSRSRRSSIFLCSWGSRVKALSEWHVWTPGIPEPCRPWAGGVGGRRQVLVDLRGGEESVGAGRGRVACAKARRQEEAGWAGTTAPRPPTRMLGSGTSPPCLLPQLKPLDPKAGWKGYCVLPGLSDHQVLHHLALQGQGLGQEEGIRPAPLVPPLHMVLGPTHQGCLLHGLAGVQPGHPGLIGSLQLLILQGGLFQGCQLPEMVTSCWPGSRKPTNPPVI